MGCTYLINITQNRKIYLSKQNIDPCYVFRVAVAYSIKVGTKVIFSSKI